MVESALSQFFCANVGGVFFVFVRDSSLTAMTRELSHRFTSQRLLLHLSFRRQSLSRPYVPVHLILFLTESDHRLAP
jgi:hypothetical protein